MKRRSFLKGMFSVPAAVFAPAVLSQELSDDDAKEMLTEQLLDDFYGISYPEYPYISEIQHSINKELAKSLRETKNKMIDNVYLSKR